MLTHVAVAKMWSTIFRARSFLSSSVPSGVPHHSSFLRIACLHNARPPTDNLHNKSQNFLFAGTEWPRCFSASVGQTSVILVCDTLGVNGGVTCGWSRAAKRVRRDGGKRPSMLPAVRFSPSRSLTPAAPIEIKTSVHRDNNSAMGDSCAIALSLDPMPLTV